MLIAAVTVLVAAYLLGGGRYQVITGQAGAPMRLDRWTGEMMVCTTHLCVLYPTQNPKLFAPPPPGARPGWPIEPGSKIELP